MSDSKKTGGGKKKRGGGGGGGGQSEAFSTSKEKGRVLPSSLPNGKSGI